MTYEVKIGTSISDTKLVLYYAMHYIDDKVVNTGETLF